MPDIDIGKNAKNLIRHARLCEALQEVDFIKGHGYEVRSWFGHLDDLLKIKSLLLEFADEDEDIRTTLYFIDAVEVYAAQKEHGRATKYQERKRAVSNYDKLFVQVGRRDGFKCVSCQITDDLQLDHVLPVALGGTSDLSNLQLLCKQCNSKKSDNVIDHRNQPENQGRARTNLPGFTG